MTQLLEELGEQVCEAIRLHALACSTAADDAPRVVAASESVRRSILDYEAAVGSESGWSSPFRHLDDDSEDDESMADAADGRDGSRSLDVQLHASYYLHVQDADALVEYVNSEVETQNVDGAVDAVRVIFERHGWNPRSHEPALWSVDDIGLTVFIEE